jgi:hypothetical protein
MFYVVKFWDDPRSSTPVEIDSLTTHSYADAEAQASARADVLRERYGSRIGYKIEGPMGEIILTVPGRPSHA